MTSKTMSVFCSIFRILETTVPSSMHTREFVLGTVQFHFFNWLKGTSPTSSTQALKDKNSIIRKVEVPAASCFDEKVVHTKRHALGIRPSTSPRNKSFSCANRSRTA